MKNLFETRSFTWAKRKKCLGSVSHPNQTMKFSKFGNLEVFLSKSGKQLIWNVLKEVLALRRCLTQWDPFTNSRSPFFQDVFKLKNHLFLCISSRKRWNLIPFQLHQLISSTYTFQTLFSFSSRERTGFKKVKNGVLLEKSNYFSIRYPPSRFANG